MKRFRLVASNRYSKGGFNAGDGFDSEAAAVTVLGERITNLVRSGCLYTTHWQIVDTEPDEPLVMLHVTIYAGAGGEWVRNGVLKEFDPANRPWTENKAP